MNNTMKRLKAEQGKTCMLSSVKSIIEYWNSTNYIDETIVLGMGPGLNINFGYFSYQELLNGEKVTKSWPAVSCFHLTFNKKGFDFLCASYGVHFSHEISDSFSGMVDQLSSELSAGRPSIITVNNRYLDYVPDELREDIGRYLVCYDLDSTANNYYVLDQYIPSHPPTYYQGAITKENFLKAIDMNHISLGNYYSAWHFRPVSSSNLEDKIKFEKVIRQSMAHSIENMNSESKEQYHFGTTKALVYSGIYAIEQFLEELIEMSGSKIAESQQQWLLRIHSLIANFGGPVKARALYGDYLKWIANNIFYIKEEAINLCSELSKDWAIAANVLFKAATYGDSKSLKRAILRIEKIINKEKLLISHLTELLN